MDNRLVVGDVPLSSTLKALLANVIIIGVSYADAEPARKARLGCFGTPLDG